MAQSLVEKVHHDFPGLTYRIVDLVESPKLGVKYGVFSTPAIAINGRLAFSGIPKEEELRKKLEEEAKNKES